MKQFANLYEQLDNTNSANAKVRLLQNFFEQATENDIVWALFFFSGRRPKRNVSSRLMREWLVEATGLPLWLVEECAQIVGDSSETLSRLHPPPRRPFERSLSEWVAIIEGLGKLSEEEKKIAILNAWDELEGSERFIFNKFITGGWRIGVSRQLVIRALAAHTGLDVSTLTHRLMGDWNAHTLHYEELVKEETNESLGSRPYPFCLAYALETPPELLGQIEEWQIEWKWDGIRAQIIRRDNELYIWSRGEELLTDRFPEFEPLKAAMPNGTVLDGEILCFNGGLPMPFNVLQTRISRTKLTAKILAEAPVKMICYDLLELEGADQRHLPLQERRAKLDACLATWSTREQLLLSEVLRPANWETAFQLRENARQLQTEGFMLKRLNSVYGVGRKKGDWWKWKIDPLTIDGVLIYAQKGSGKRANLYTDYTFGVWNEGKLVSFAKAYSGLTDKEIAAVDAYIKANTLEKFGPVRTVKPGLVMEIGFEGILASGRHKSGVALRFPRILRLRTDKPIEEADTLENLKALLPNGQK